MNKITKIFLIGSLCGSGVSGLEFGGMGNISASMGGAGVALRNSQWALYYNPALLGLDTKSRIAYSFGASIAEKNLLSLASVDYKNFENIPNKINGIFKKQTSTKSIGGAILSGAVTSSPVNMDGVFGEVLKNVSFGSTSGLKTTVDVQNFMKDILSSSGATSVQVNEVKNATDLSSASSAFKSALIQSDGSLNSNGVLAFGKLKTSILDGISKTTDGDTSIFENIIRNVQPEQLGGIADLLAKAKNGGSLSLDEVLSTIGTVSISKGSDSQINRFIKDVDTIEKTLKKNNFNISSQNGLVFQIAGKGADSRGAIAFGVFENAFASASATFDSTHNQIIIDADNNYAKINITDNAIELSPSNKADYDKYSLLSDNANHQAHGKAISITEVPIAYGQAFSTPIGNFSIGVVAKYIYALGYVLNETGSFDNVKDGFSNMDFKNAPKNNTFGIDIGLLYNYKGFNVGIVGKDLNAPVIKVNDNQKIILNPQVRGGISYEWKILSFAMDIDLKPNHTLSYIFPKNQMIGGGAMVDLKYFDFRLGAMYDMVGRADEGIILTGGINILGFLDLAVQSNLKMANVGDYKIPSYLSVKLGGGFSW